MSEFLGFVEPPGAALLGYDPKQLHHQQPKAVPAGFTEAMSVREDVFVSEQHVPLEKEYDEDDARSYHWVAYASVGTTGSPSVGGRDSANDIGVKEEVTWNQRNRPQAERKGSTARRLAIGTIRLVPPYEPGSHHKIGNKEGMMPGPENRTTPMHDGKEPYVKLGRLAVLKPYRGLGLANLLINAALTWASQNPNTIFPPLSPTAAEHRRLERGGVQGNDDHWKGLVLVHAQKAVGKVWTRYGFVEDESMGEWVEEGIYHIGMWKRIGLHPRRTSVV